MTRRSVVVFVALCLIWGSTWLFIKIGLEDSPPLLSAGFRFLLAAIVLYPVMKMRGLSFPSDRKILGLMLYTGFFAVSVAYGLVYWSEQYISSGLAAVLFSTFPFFVIVFSHFMLSDDRMTRTKILGAVLGFSGVALIFLDSLSIENLMTLYGILGVIISAICAAISNVTIKRNAGKLDPIVLTEVQMICGAISLLSVGFLVEELDTFRWTFKSIGSLVYLAIMGSCVGFIAYYWLIKRVKITTAALIVFVIPIVALFLDWIIMGQLLNWWMFLGSGMVIGGIGLANR